MDARSKHENDPSVRCFGTWVFDDPETGLVAEPFVNGVPEIIESIAGDADRFSVDFNDGPFSGWRHVLCAIQPEAGGHVYFDESTGPSGWLCPALNLYFKEAPVRICMRFNEELRSRAVLQ